MQKSLKSQYQLVLSGGGSIMILKTPLNALIIPLKLTSINQSYRFEIFLMEKNNLYALSWLGWNSTSLPSCGMGGSTPPSPPNLLQLAHSLDFVRFCLLNCFK